MRIMVLFPGEGVLPPEKLGEELRWRKDVLMQFASPGTDIEPFNTKGTKAMIHGRDAVMIAPSTLELAIQGEKDGFDAIIINGM